MVLTYTGVKMNKSHLTAIPRKKPSLPLRVLVNSGKINLDAKILDFGCGRGKDYTWLSSMGYNARGYDPHWNRDEEALKNKYDVVLCSYVLNVVDKTTQKQILDQLKSLTKTNGKIYVSVRRDLKEDYVSSKGTQQYLVKLPYTIFKETSDYCIYEIEEQG